MGSLSHISLATFAILLMAAPAQAVPFFHIVDPYVPWDDDIPAEDFCGTFIQDWTWRINQDPTTVQLNEGVVIVKQFIPLQADGPLPAAPEPNWDTVRGSLLIQSVCYIVREITECLKEKWALGEDPTECVEFRP